MSEFVTVRAAEALLSAASGGAWALADAVAEDTKDRQTDTEVEDILELIVEALGERGVVTPNGEPYLMPALVTMRRTSLAWPADERHQVAAYRTHQEAGARGSVGRAALKALAAVAAGEVVECPADVDPEAWAGARARVEKRLAGRRPRYLVAANDLRVAIQRVVNVPPRQAEMKAGVVHLLDEVRVASTALRGFARRFVDADPSTEEREAIGSSLRSLISRAEETLAVVSAGDLSDESLAELLQEESK